MVAGAAWRAPGGNRSSVWRSNSPQTCLMRPFAFPQTELEVRHTCGPRFAALRPGHRSRATRLATRLKNGYHGFDTVNLHTHGLHVSPLKPGDEIVNTKVTPGETYEYTYHAHSRRPYRRHALIPLPLARGGLDSRELWRGQNDHRRGRRGEPVTGGGRNSGGFRMPCRPRRHHSERRDITRLIAQSPPPHSLTSPARSTDR